MKWTKTIAQIEQQGLAACDFKNDCDVCENPKGRTFAVGWNGEDCESYICRKCAEASYDEYQKYLESK